MANLPSQSRHHKRKGDSIRQEQGILRLGPSGTMILPNAVRDKLGIVGGAYLKADVKKGRLVLIPVTLTWAPKETGGAKPARK